MHILLESRTFARQFNVQLTYILFIMANKITLTALFAFSTLIIAVAQKAKPNSLARYIAPSVIVGSQIHLICPYDTQTLEFSDGNDESGNVSSSTIDSLAPFLRIAECTPQTIRIEWHLPIDGNSSSSTFTLRKNNAVIYTAVNTAQTSALNIPTPSLSQGDALQINVQRGTLHYQFNAVFVTSLLTPFLASGNAPMPMATVEIVHPRRVHTMMRDTPNNVAGQCLYVHDAENVTAAYYRTTDVLSVLNSSTIDLTDSLYNAAIAGKTAYITHDYSVGNCDNDNSSQPSIKVADVYPNPSEESFHIQYDAKMPSDVKVTVSDLQGREVFSYQGNSQAE
ncbi:MAG: hypothetical protein RIS64_3001, partial [Bacteroidota bacterium]